MFKRALSRIFLFVAFIFLITGCEFSNDEGPKLTIVSEMPLIKSYGAPYLLVKVRNIGERSAYNAACSYRALRGDTIVGTATAYFAGLDNIDSGQSAEAEAIFFDLKSHEDYDTLKRKLTWLNR